MADSGPRYCPRCGTARLPGMAFCANCGLDLRSAPPDEMPPAEPPGPLPTPLPPAGGARLPPPTAEPQSLPPRQSEPGPALWPRLLPAALLLIVLALAVLYIGGLGPFGGMGTPVDSATPGPTAPTPFPTVPAGIPTPVPVGSLPPGFTPPPVGLTILSPADGAVLGSADVTVIGSAPPGVRITQDISFGLDQHATVDATGHWAISLRLAEGENELKFRIGDDRSTERRIRVTYRPP